MTNHAVMVISGYNIRAVVAFCRWATANRVRFHIIAKNKEDPIFLTDYKDYVSFTRDSPQLHHEVFCTWVDSLCHQYTYQKLSILPSTEGLNRFLLENRSSIESKNCIIPLVNEQLYRKISDKHSFAKLCQSYELYVPAEFNQIPEHLPFVAKPRSYFSAKGSQLIPHLIHTPQDLENFCRTEDKKDYFFQQFIYGHSLYLLAYIAKESRSDNNIVFSQENLMQQARGGSIVLAKHSQFHQEEVARKYVTMLQEQHFFGLVMVEVRLDGSNGGSWFAGYFGNIFPPNTLFSGQRFAPSHISISQFGSTTTSSSVNIKSSPRASAIPLFNALFLPRFVTVKKQRGSTFAYFSAIISVSRSPALSTRIISHSRFFVCKERKLLRVSSSSIGRLNVASITDIFMGYIVVGLKSEV